MLNYTTLNEIENERLYIEEFKGFNSNLRIQDGQFCEMKNMTGDNYPCVSTRKDFTGIDAFEESSLNTAIAAFKHTQGPDAEMQIQGIYVDGNIDNPSSFTMVILSGRVYINGIYNSDISGLISSGKKNIVPVGNYVTIFPDGAWFNKAQTITEYGKMANSFTPAAGTLVNYEICKADGSGYGTITYSASEPEDPNNSDLWMDTSGDIHCLKQYNESYAMWQTVATTYVRISAAEIDAGFEVGDGILITLKDADASTDQVKSLNGSNIIKAKGDGYIVVTGLIDQTVNITLSTSYTDCAFIKRELPVLDYVVQHNNRIWGCRKGIQNFGGKTQEVNEIYCSKLGDFKNWQVYAGISTDSYAATVGSPGPFTGAIVYNNTPMFFKETCVHRVYSSGTGAHQIQETQLDGVQDGCNASLQIVDDLLYYKSKRGFCVYDGATSARIDAALYGHTYYDVVAGKLGTKYLVTATNEQNDKQTMYYDTATSSWWMLDDTNVLHYVPVIQTFNNAVIMIVENGYFNDQESYIEQDDIYVTSDKSDDIGPDQEWYITTGNIGFSYPDKKYLSRFNIRAQLSEGSEMTIYTRYDNEKEWYEVGTVYGEGIKTFNYPIIPRRCDHMQIKFAGHGAATIYSISKVLERGSEL